MSLSVDGDPCGAIRRSDLKTSNGFLKWHCHGTRNVLPQLIQSVRMRQVLPLLKDRLDKNENSQTVDFLNRVTGKVDRRSDVLGKVTNKNLCVLCRKQGFPLKTT